MICFLTVSANGIPTHFVDSVSFGAAAVDESFGRFPNGSGRIVPLQELTFGQGNSDPRVGPVVISEINYDPGVPSAAALEIDANLSTDDLEFIEIHNPTSAAIELNQWRLRGGVDYDFDATSTLEAGQTIVVLSFNPANPDNASRLAAFRAHYAIGPDVILVGGTAVS